MLNRQIDSIVLYSIIEYIILYYIGHFSRIKDKKNIYIYIYIYSNRIAQLESLNEFYEQQNFSESYINQINTTIFATRVSMYLTYRQAAAGKTKNYISKVNERANK